MFRELSAPVFCVLMLASCVATAPGYAPQESEPTPDRPVQTGTVYVGIRELSDESTFDPVDDQAAVGVMYDARWAAGSVVEIGGEVGAFSSWWSKERETLGDDFSVSALTWEIGLGPRVTFKLGNSGLRAYVAGGVAFIFGGVDVHGHDDDDLDVDDSDNSPGFYAHTGIFYSFAKNFSAGIDYRVMRSTEVEIFGDDDDNLDYNQLTVFGGYSF